VSGANFRTPPLIGFRPIHLWKTETPIKDGEALSKMREIVTSVEENKMSYGTEDSRPHWFAAYTIPRHEKHVQELLTERGIENFLPLYRATRQWKKSCPAVLDLPLFPTYVFVRIGRMARGRVLSMPGVLSIVGSPNRPWPLPDSEMEALQLGIQAHKIEPHPYLRFGETVRIKAGLMSGVEGILIRKKNEFRVVITVNTIMRSVAVEVDVDDIEPLKTPVAKIAREGESGGSSQGSAGPLGARKMEGRQ
jgi:transcription antitermination factor NusG